MPDNKPARIFTGGPWQLVFDEINKLGDQLDALQADVAFIKGHLASGSPITTKDLSDLKAAAARIRAIDKKES